ncbi:MAG: hypothetical protein Q4C64_03685 [Erysipelotrichia bacterium]|nr:hypothetical protein [Erysipelotrichia bacterium]
MNKKKQEKNLKKKMRKAMVATTTAASLLVNNSYDNPLEIIDDTYADGIMEMYEKDEKNPYKNKARQYLSLIPQPVRAIILLPLWCIGWVIMLIIRPLWTNILSGFAADISHWLILLLVVLTAIIISSIIMFPGLPFKKLCNKKTILLTAGIIASLLLVDKYLQTTNQEYNNISATIKLVGSLLTVISMLIYNYFKNRKVKVIAHNNQYEFRN